MPTERPRPRSVIEQPGRLAAIGGAAVICLLSVSGALGLPPGGDHGVQQHQASVTQQDSLDSAPAPGASDSPTGSGTGTGTSSGIGIRAGASNGSATSAAVGVEAGSAADDPAHSSTSTPAPGGSSTAAQDTALPANSGTGKRVVFGATAQRVWLVGSDGKVARTYLVSGSKYDNLDLGTYHVNSRSRHATAYNSDETMSYMVRFALGRIAPIGFHSIPAHPDGTLAEARSSLGTPQSDGCIRQWITDARALWEFAPVGTTVVVLA